LEPKDNRSRPKMCVHVTPQRWLYGIRFLEGSGQPTTFIGRAFLRPGVIKLN